MGKVVEMVPIRGLVPVASCSAHRGRGQALVEFALVLPLFLLLISAMVYNPARLPALESVSIYHFSAIHQAAARPPPAWGR